MESTIMGFMGGCPNYGPLSDPGAIKKSLDSRP